MLLHRQRREQHVVLGTETHGSSHPLDRGVDVEAVHRGGAARTGEQTYIRGEAKESFL